MDLMRLDQEDRNTGWDADANTDEGTFTVLSIEFYYANGNFQEGMGFWIQKRVDITTFKPPSKLQLHSRYHSPSPES